MTNNHLLTILIIAVFLFSALLRAEPIDAAMPMAIPQQDTGAKEPSIAEDNTNIQQLPQLSEEAIQEMKQAMENRLQEMIQTIQEQRQISQNRLQEMEKEKSGPNKLPPTKETTPAAISQSPQPQEINPYLIKKKSASRVKDILLGLTVTIAFTIGLALIIKHGFIRVK